VDAADLAVLGPDDVVGVLEGVQRVEYEDRVVAMAPGGFLQLWGRSQPEEPFPAVAVRDSPVVEANSACVCGVFGDERVEDFQGVVAAVLLEQVPAQSFAVPAVDLPAGFLGHAGDSGGVDGFDQVVLAGGGTAGDDVAARVAGRRRLQGGGQGRVGGHDSCPFWSSRVFSGDAGRARKP
jgi:hypothetical protein